MSCPNCNHPLKDDAIICESCGFPVNLKTDTKPETTDSVSEEENITQIRDLSDKTEDKPKKNKTKTNKAKKEKKKFTKKKAIILSAVSLLLAVIILFVSLNFTAVIGFLIKTFGSDAAYFKFVEKNSFDSYSVDIMEAIDNYRDVFKSDFCKDIIVKMHAEDEIISIAEEHTEAEYGISLGWLNDLLVEGTVNVKDQKTQAELTASLGNKEITDISFIKFSETGDQYLGFPCLTDKYLHTQTEPQKSLTTGKLLDDPDIKALLPSTKERNKILARYLMIIIKEIDKDSVKGYDKEVTVSGATEKLRVLEFTMDTDTANTIKKNILVKMRDDKEIKDIIERFAPVLEKKEVIKSSDTLYSDFTKTIDKELAQVEKYLKNPQNKELFKLVDYVNNKHIIVGRDLIIDNEKVYSFIKLQENYTISTSAQIEGHRVTLNGSGTLKEDILKGKFSFNTDGTTYLNVTLSEMNIEDAKNGNFQSKLTLTPTKALLDKYLTDESSYLKYAKPSVVLELDINKDTAMINAYATALGKELMNISLSATNATPYTITKPDDKYIVNEENKDEFFASFDKLTLFERIRDSGIYKEISDWDLFIETLSELGVSPALCTLLKAISFLF